MKVRDAGLHSYHAGDLGRRSNRQAKLFGETVLRISNAKSMFDPREDVATYISMNLRAGTLLAESL